MLGTEVETVTATERELAVAGPEPNNVPVTFGWPLVYDSGKRTALGWNSTDRDTTMERTPEQYLDGDRDQTDSDCGSEAAVLDYPAADGRPDAACGAPESV